MVALPKPRPSQVDIDKFEKDLQAEMRRAVSADQDLGDPESFDFAMPSYDGGGRALIRDSVTGDLMISQEPGRIAVDRQRQAGSFAQGLAMGLTTDLLGLPADLLALIFRDAPQLGAALFKSVTTGTPVAEEVAEMSKNPNLLDQALTIVQGTLGGDAIAKYAGMTEEELQDPALQTGRIAAAAFDPFVLAGVGRAARSGTKGLESLTGEVLPSPVRQEPTIDLGAPPSVVEGTADEGIGTLLPAPRTPDLSTLPRSEVTGLPVLRTEVTERMATPEETAAFLRGEDPAQYAPGAQAPTTLEDIPTVTLPGREPGTTGVGGDIEVRDFEPDTEFDIQQVFETEENTVHVPTGITVPEGTMVRGNAGDFQPAAADDIIEGEIVTPATAPQAEEAAELFDAAAEARRQQAVAEPSSSLFESPEAGSQYAYDAVQGDQIGAFQALPDRRSANKTFTIDDTDEFGGEVSHFSNIMTTIASRGERNKLPKKAGQLDALFSKGTARPEYENSKLREILREDPDKSYTVDEIAKLANENLPQTRTRTYLASKHDENVASGKMPSYFERGINYSYKVDNNGEVSLTPSDTQLDPFLRDARQDAGRVIFSSTKPPEPIVFSDGSVIQDIPFTVRGHSYGQGDYPGFYAHSRFIVVEDASTGKRYMVPYEIQSDTINQIERARYAVGPDGSVKSLKDRLEKYNEGHGEAGTVRIPLTDETKELIKKYDEIFPAALTRHAKAEDRINELQGDASGEYYPNGGRAREAIIPKLQKRLKDSRHPNIASDVDSKVYTDLETSAILRDMDAEVLTALGGNQRITSLLDPLRQARAADTTSVDLYSDEFRNLKDQLMGYDVNNPDVLGGLEPIVEEVLARKGFVRSLENEKTIIEFLDYELSNAMRSYIRNYAGRNKTFMEHFNEELNDALDRFLSLYISARRIKSLMNQNSEVEKYFIKPTAEQLSNAETRTLDNYNQIMSDLGVTNQQETIADEVVDAVANELKRDLPESAAANIDTWANIGKQANAEYNPRVSEMFQIKDYGYELYAKYAHALEELRKVYESGDLLEPAEIQRLNNDFDLSLSRMGEEGEMIRNLRKVIQDSGEGRYKGFIGVPPHSDNKQFFRFAPKALAKEAEKLGLDGIIFMDADDIVSMGRPGGQSNVEMFRRTYDNELNKGLVDFQNASPNAVVRRDVNKRNPDGSVDPNNTFAAKVIDSPQDANLTPGGAVVIGGRGKGLRIIDFDSGNNREVLQRPIRRAKGGEVDLRPKKMIHSGIGAMAREMM